MFRVSENVLDLPGCRLVASPSHSTESMLTSFRCSGVLRPLLSSRACCRVVESHYQLSIYVLLFIIVWGVLNETFWTDCLPHLQSSSSASLPSLALFQHLNTVSYWVYKYVTHNPVWKRWHENMTPLHYGPYLDNMHAICNMNRISMRVIWKGHSTQQLQHPDWLGSLHLTGPFLQVITRQSIHSI